MSLLGDFVAPRTLRQFDVHYTQLAVARPGWGWPSAKSASTPQPRAKPLTTIPPVVRAAGIGSSDRPVTQFSNRLQMRRCDCGTAGGCGSGAAGTPPSGQGSITK